MLRESPYEMLGLKGDFTFKDIKKAYRIAIRNNPPEQNPEKFAQISDAYDILTNENYFINSSNSDIFTLHTDIEVAAQERPNNKEYLKKIFETPFK